MKRRSALVGVTVTTSAAVLGNAFVGKEALDWFRELNSPRWQLPMSGFLTVGALYYALVGYVLARGLDRRDLRVVVSAVAVLAGNEGWNVLLFGRRSTKAAFLGLLAFLVPLVSLQRSVSRDRRSRWLLAPYTAYVVLYDLPWAYWLWRRNLSRANDLSAGVGGSLTR